MGCEICSLFFKVNEIQTSLTAEQLNLYAPIVAAFVISLICMVGAWTLFAWMGKGTSKQQKVAGGIISTLGMLEAVFILAAIICGVALFADLTMLDFLLAAISVAGILAQYLLIKRHLIWRLCMLVLQTAILVGANIIFPGLIYLPF